MPTFDFIPADTLFCRDQRPLAAGSSFGHGANWPLPTVLHSALRTALLRHLGPLPQRKGREGYMRRGQKRGKIATDAYQWLNICGPFPVDKAGTLYFPIPRDLVPDGQNKEGVACLQVSENPGGNNLPKPLTHLATSFAKPSKDTLPEWVSWQFYKRYLDESDLPGRPGKPELWDSEHRIGIAIDPETQTAAEGRLYAAEHLRLRDGVKLRFSLSDPPLHKPANPNEKIDLADVVLQLGGELRFGWIQEGTELVLPNAVITGPLIKWVLLTPAIFIRGWRPGWVDDQGNVKLRAVDKSKRADRRRPRYSDVNWKYDESKDDAAPIVAKLVAACVGKPQVVGGWDDQPKPTQLAVPSGSVYYFRAESDADARRLAKVLQGRCRSDFFGEKGLGLGVCGSWAKQDQTSGNVPVAAPNLKTS